MGYHVRDSPSPWLDTTLHEIILTIGLSSLRAQWQQSPTGPQKFCIGNMNRYVEIYSEDGQQLAQLGGPQITAVPAVAKFHPTMDWVAAGSASGKVCLW